MEDAPVLNYTMIENTKKHSGAMKHKINTDKLRDMLREKCRIRIKESRFSKFDVSRQFLENEKQWLTDVLKVELSEIEIDMELENIILNELIAEQYQWMVDQYEQTNEVDLSGDRSFIVLCPICQLSELQLISHLLKCQCGFQQNFSGSLEDFWKKVQRKITDHEETCVSKLMFFMDPNESVLNAMCNNCDFLALVE